MNPQPPHKLRVLFVCIGNACRSQMAEAFARCYGDDILVAASAGVSPAFGVARDTIRVMDERKLDLRDHFPKSLKQLGRARFDIAVNMTGDLLPEDVAPSVIDWNVDDPIGLKYEQHCEVRDKIEQLVMGLIQELRSEPQRSRMRGQGSGRLPL